MGKDVWTFPPLSFEEMARPLTEINGREPTCPETIRWGGWEADNTAHCELELGHEGDCTVTVKF